MYYICSGSITLVDLNIQVKQGQLIGEMGIFSPFNERTDTAICDSDMEIYMIDEDKINQLYYQNPQFGFYLIRLLTKRFILNAQTNQK
jgi:CRP/FNR family transcriptional regulator, cyclic AMP receptor protein